MAEIFADEDTRLPPLERARLGANGSVFASPNARGLYELLFAEAWPVVSCSAEGCVVRVNLASEAALLRRTQRPC